MRRTAWLLLLFLIFASNTLAQGGDCPAIVDSALQTAADACTSLSRNQACYGNVTLEAEAQAGASFTFEQTGDIVNLSDVASLSLSAMTEDAWGVALLLLQANLPDTLPGQNVTMVLFGEVVIASAVPVEVAVEPTPEPRPIVFIATPSSSINVRSGPSTSDAVVASLGVGDEVPTDGRNQDSTWLHVRFEDGTTGWVFAELVSVDGDISLLPVTDGAAPIVEVTEESPVEPSYTPMQAFYFNSSIGDSGCEQAPDSGILIQTPQGAGTVNLLINEVEITLGSTAYLTAGDGVMTISVIEGQGTVSAFGTTVSVPAGTRAHIPLDSNGLASGAPVGPAPYDTTDLNALPIVLLPQPVTVAPPLTDEEIAALSVGLYEGEWTFTVVIEEVTRLPDLLQAGTHSYTVTYAGYFDFFPVSLAPALEDSAALMVGFMIAEAQNSANAEFTVSNTYSQTSASVPDGMVEFTVVSTTLITGTFQEDAYGTIGTFTLEAND